jgi:hypothetical protein
VVMDVWRPLASRADDDDWIAVRLQLRQKPIEPARSSSDLTG